MEIVEQQLQRQETQKHSPAADGRGRAHWCTLQLTPVAATYAEGHSAEQHRA